VGVVPSAADRHPSVSRPCAATVISPTTRTFIRFLRRPDDTDPIAMPPSRLITVLLAAVILLGSGCSLLAHPGSPSSSNAGQVKSQISVPLVIGMTPSKAVETLHRRGFANVRFSAQTRDLAAKPGTIVIQQSPKLGTTISGKHAVELYLGKAGSVP
jgi:hypothetical protein